MADPTILIGAVAYDPKVVTIWEGMREHFQEHGVSLDFALFSSYERQIEALLHGHVDIAWNSGISHVRVKRRTEGKSIGIAMRDRDRDVCAKILIRREVVVRKLTDLHGKVLAVGTRDSAQSRILPLYYLKQAGVDLNQVKILAFDSDVGKHGDTGASELAVLAAVHEGRAHAGAVGSLVFQAEQAAGHVDPRIVDVLWTTPTFDLRMFDAMPTLAADKVEAFKRTLSEMAYANPKHRKLLDMEGLRRWIPGREQSYAPVRAALDDLPGFG
ncbi:phosphate/phosphite/phosphonate ABC transporter substrate-binding protein [Polyangium jinanense]|uniref:PhnD/SsuA/transferrin family substrate-binding protein n=1 Tax=Polyangium jinanense TaxID=2829994 RepID=A0A9X4AW97_9BACT|nr:PhnD/SsuA/transferrin family substrate-binding protein [Polyangium jinanense]MDC3956850.1 PhnD/SsuA/transferrin family substrate-binding protein [Polyangium jinanense]MDC3957679.1 PhnD/SsuA/transferrin family substrate-binding protein [Polyangium jinanense]MDC3987113.1 PhnD/SsuA/transferrin family substrate-binding protein [Polyangium jinanense]